jgi:SagB-type dehydrogenase family enzyme
VEKPPVRLKPGSQASADPVERVILRRGSTRRFLRDPITLEQLSTVLGDAARPLACDFRAPDQPINAMYLIVNAVEELEPGAYFFDQTSLALVLLKAGSFRAEAAYLCLEQNLLGQAAVVVFLMADLGATTQAQGPRGYRAALLEAGILGGRLYLDAYALKLGATGSTFYDDEVTEFFSPHARGKSPILAIGVGRDPRFEPSQPVSPRRG